jgi:spermidine/putrescine transport system substrate-binding protein
VLPSSYMAEVMQQQGMLKPIDKTLIPNLSKIDPTMIRTKTDAVMNYSVPYLMSFTGVGYNISKVNKPTSWDVFENPAVARRSTMLNDMRETIGAALKYLGYSYNTVNTAELAKAEALLMQWKKNIAKLDVDEAKRGLDSGEFYAVHHYSGDIIQLMQENPAIGFFFPAEGTSIASDDFVILKDAPQSELAHRFINFCLEPANCAENMEFVFYLSPNAEALKLLPDSVKSNPAFMPSAEIMAKSEMIRDLGEKNRLYSKIWDRFVSGK